MSTFIPAYKDTFYEYSGDSLSYYITMHRKEDITEDEGYEIIYQGKAVKGPNEATIKININRIAKDYLEQYMDDFRVPGPPEYILHRDAFKFFSIYSDDGTLLQTYGVLFDWEGNFDGNSKCLSDPIRPNISAQMDAVFTIFSLLGETQYIGVLPSVLNTFFTLVTDSLAIAHSGGTYRIEYLTDYYPVTDVVLNYPSGTVQAYGNRSWSGMTVNFLASPVDGDREFTLTLKRGNTTLGTVRVLQGSVYFNLITKNLQVPVSGGSYNVRWTTEIDPQYITVNVGDYPGATVTGIYEYGCTLSIPANLLYNDYPFTVAYYYDTGGTPYYLDATHINVRGRAGATSGDTGTTSACTIDSAVTRDLLFTQDGVFAGFNNGEGIMIWRNVDLDQTGYYPQDYSQYSMGLFPADLPLAGGFSNNIPLCKKSEVCSAQSFTSFSIEGYKLSGSTQWINDYLTTAKEYECTNVGNSETYSGDTFRSGVLYLYSGSTLLDSAVVVQPPYKANWYNLPIGSGDTGYHFSDLKFKATEAFDENSIKAVLINCFPAFSHTNIYDGVKVVTDSGRNTADWGSYRKYGSDSIALETDNNGWTTVKTPLPINEIVTLSGIPASEIWISRNVRAITPYNTDITAVTYEGTRQDFRNVAAFLAASITSVTCSDGTSYGVFGRKQGKSEPLALEANMVRPALCDEYFYETDDPTPSNVIEITLTGDTTGSTSHYNYFFSRDGQFLTPTITTGMSGEYATVTLTFSEPVFGCTRINNRWRSISDTLWYFYPDGAAYGGSNLATIPTRMRIIGDRAFSGNTNTSTALTLNNLRGVVGARAFMDTPVRKLSAPNVVTLAVSAFTGSVIEELYIPSVQTLGSYSIPATCTKVTVGKSLNNVSGYAFKAATSLQSLYFNGSVEEWQKLITLGVNIGNATLKNNSSIDIIYCDNGEITVDRQ